MTVAEWTGLGKLFIDVFSMASTLFREHQQKPPLFNPKLIADAHEQLQKLRVHARILKDSLPEGRLSDVQSNWAAFAEGLLYSANLLRVRKVMSVGAGLA
jgi:hypothetical protein